MESANISTLRNRLSEFLRKVRAGQPVLILDRGRPVARIERIERVGGAGGADDERLARLEAAGLVRRPVRPVPFAALNAAPPQPERSVLAALIEERTEATAAQREGFAVAP